MWKWWISLNRPLNISCSTHEEIWLEGTSDWLHPLCSALACYISNELGAIYVSHCFYIHLLIFVCVCHLLALLVFGGNVCWTCDLIRLFTWPRALPHPCFLHGHCYKGPDSTIDSSSGRYRPNGCSESSLSLVVGALQQVSLK